MSELEQLTKEERVRLMQFICSFAWADLEIRPQERDFIARMVQRLQLDAGERQQVTEWLRTPPPPEAVDPELIPVAHRRLFVETIEGLIAADADLAPEETESLEVLRELLAPPEV